MPWLSNLDKGLLTIVREIGEEAQAKNVPAYLVGGIVRDLMLKINSRDLDIVIEGDAIGLARGLAGKFNASLVVHEQFGTATMNLEDGQRVDLVTARKEVYPSPGALPVVSRGNIRDDLFRRDFTLNAMALKINPAKFGELVDEFAGRKDLEKKRVRVLHELSFQDDPTRILRAVRFEQRFGFHLESGTEKLLTAALKNRQEERVKPERYYHEFQKMFREPQPWKNLKRLKELGGCAFLGKGVRISVIEWNRLRSVYKQVQRNPQAVDRENIDTVLPGLMVILEKAKERQLVDFIQRFNLSKSQQVGLKQARLLGPVKKELARKELKPSAIYRALKDFRLEVLLFLRADDLAPVARRRLDLFLKDLGRIRLSVNGADLGRLGIESSRGMGEILKGLLEMKIDGRLKSRQDELDMAGQLAAGKQKGHHGPH